LNFLDQKYREGCYVGVAWHTNDVLDIIGEDRLNSHLFALKKNIPFQ
jgi:hypothetical protein